MTNHLKHLISFRQWNMSDETAVVNAVREACSYVSMDWKRDLELCKWVPTLFLLCARSLSAAGGIRGVTRLCRNMSFPTFRPGARLGRDSSDQDPTPMPKPGHPSLPSRTMPFRSPGPFRPRTKNRSFGWAMNGSPARNCSFIRPISASSSPDCPRRLRT